MAARPVGSGVNPAMKRCFVSLIVAGFALTATDSFGQAFFEIRKLDTPPADFNPSIEGDYVLADYGTDPIDDSSVSRFKIGALGGLGGLTIALDETFVGIGTGGFLQSSPLFPRYRVAADRLSVELFGAVVPGNTYFEIVHSTPYAIRANLLGDATHDGGLSAGDIDATNREIATGGADPTFDLNFDGLVNAGDTRHLVETLIGTRFGDLNLDRAVTRLDAALLAGNYGATTNVGWAGGDFDGAGGVNLRDLVEVGRNLGFARNSPAAGETVAAVPEPGAVGLLPPALLPLGLWILGDAYRRRRKT